MKLEDLCIRRNSGLGTQPVPAAPYRERGACARDSVVCAQELLDREVHETELVGVC